MSRVAVALLVLLTTLPVGVVATPTAGHPITETSAAGHSVAESSAANHSLAESPAAGHSAADTPAAATSPTAAAFSAPVRAATSTASPEDDSTAALPEDGTAPETGSDIQRTISLSLTPDRPGNVGVLVSLRIPDRVGSLTMEIPSDATVTESRGFDRSDDAQWSWDGRTANPSLRFTFPVNRSFGGYRAPAESGGLPVTDASAGAGALAGRHGTAGGDVPADRHGTVGGDVYADRYATAVSGARRPRYATASGTRRPPYATARQAAQEAGYSFVDTGPWAVAPVPSISTRWGYSGATVGLDGEVVVDGQGATGGEIAYLGPATTYTREAGGQTLRLVVPAAATMHEDPEAVLDSLSDASGSLAVGARDPEVFIVAAPTSVNWGPAGIEYGGSDAWVRDSSRLDVAANIWLHEYVHTRFTFSPTTETRWLLEGPTEYYAALLTLEQGRIGFTQFRSHLARGTDRRYDESVLSQPTTWAPLANYYRGAAVFGALDYRIRSSTDEQTADDVVARLNRDEDTITQSEFRSAVEAVGGGDAGAFAREYTTTSATPSLWTVSEHAAAFPGTPAVRYTVSEGEYRVTGPYRNRTVSPNESLVTGETLHVSVPVRNIGDTAGDYEVTLSRDGSTLARASASLPAGEEGTAALVSPLAAPGQYLLSAGTASLTFPVLDPAALRVTDLSANATTVRPGGAVTVRATVQSAESRPGRGDVAVYVDGERVASRTVAVDDGEARTVSVTVHPDGLGSHEIRVGDLTASVEVRSATTTESSRTGDLPWPTVLAGLGVALAGLARLGASGNDE
ncbi:MAG: hypothetical protein ABEJ22_02350 [Haloferacaceae archaeon]